MCLSKDAIFLFTPEQMKCERLKLSVPSGFTDSPCPQGKSTRFYAAVVVWRAQISKKIRKNTMNGYTDTRTDNEEDFRDVLAKLSGCFVLAFS